MTAVLHPAPRQRPAPTAHRAEPSPSWFRTRSTGLALTILLATTAVLYFWNLTASGYANTFYAAAAQAGSQNWKAWFFGSLDTSNFITVDKPPASLWVMGVSGRIFGFSSASLLVPQALMGIGSVALVYAAVKRVASPAAGLVAGAVLAATPAAALMFKFDNPDALLVLLMTLAGYFVIRAMCTAIGRRAAMWVALAGVALGFAFLTKMLQGLMVLPAFGAAYLIAGQVRLRTRLAHLVIGAASVVISAGWWVLAVWLWPADSRPYIGGSTNNSVMDLVMGYNGLGRLFGSTGGGGGMAGGSAGSSFGGSTGLERLFGSEMGIQISWLIPAALIAVVFGLLARGRAPRTDLVRASLILWGGWFLVTGLIFSYMSGTIHPYYTVALAPAVAGMIGTGGYALWLVRARWIGRCGLAATMLAAGIWSWVLLHRNADWLPMLKWILLAGTVVGAILVLVGAKDRFRKLAVAGLILGSLAGITGSASYAIATAATAHGGSIPTAGPTGAVSDSGMGGGGGMGGGPELQNGDAPPNSSDATVNPASNGQELSSGSESTSELTGMLVNAGTTWSAATNGSQSAATYELASNTAVMAIGGWSSDPAPTLDQFIQYVADGKIHYYIAGGQGGSQREGQSGDSTSSVIQEWVEANFTSTTVGNSTIYDLSGYVG
ncbi:MULTISPECIES: glycosyltransferase family 39 protein [unclassified Rhodococcus (in: high G+C Gram-positive bacteria)]|uniref:glycosyltransferase family 39 protein n=1 Tax=unclassified Rhodococcus (in: high G+C Gram-positive bacteria) TaxID=192944 RepID=UPI0024B699AA|nr:MULTISPECIES: glycosyltransferase family 39 protein [unclassified Rhodococcus (in: high G+C Gram-positive bacteria)]MDI9958840.1 glycosyltransferase family 39 protein [Rhodococcus sp. IEGM 1237]MDI9964485.1 glycosyltransferase family 39 protein [Rhodococcus sp. IEGM 1251]MDV8126899.1 glycosyltransferase family 39 protein [Rhodococcus sp. IEGM 1304]